MKKFRYGSIAVGALVVLLLLLAYWVRPLAIIHGPIWYLVKMPAAWFWPSVIGLVAATPFFAVGIPRYSRQKAAHGVARAEHEKRHADDSYHYSYGYSGPSAPSFGFALWGASAFFIVGLVTWAAVFSWLTPKWMAHETYKHYKYVTIKTLPQAGEIRVVPQEVADGAVSSGYNVSGHQVGAAHIVIDPRTKTLTWTFAQEPSGLVNTYRGKQIGNITLDAEHTGRISTRIDKDFKFGIGMKISDSLNWQFRKRHYFGVPTSPIATVTAKGEPIDILPWLAYKGGLVKYPTLGGVMVFHADGRIEDLSPAEAEARPEIVDTGRLIPETLARQIQDAYAYKLGVSNEMFTHKDQTSIQDNSDSDNHMPYLMSFREGDHIKEMWVSVAEPRGKAYAVSAIFLTDAITGVTQVWRSPKDSEITGPNRAIQLVHQQPIAGIVYATTAGEQGRFQAVEPRPLFINGHLKYLVSIVGASNPQDVTKSVIVDAEKERVIAVFNHDSDSQADDKLVRYLRTGQLDSSAIVTPSQIGQGTGSTPTSPANPATPTPTPTPTAPVVTGPVGKQIDAIQKNIDQAQAQLDQLKKTLAAAQAKAPKSAGK